MQLQIGENIRTNRQRLKLTQEELAQKLGVSFQSVSRWENGITYPDIELLPMLAMLFDISVDTLIGTDKAQEEEKTAEYYEMFTHASGKEERLKILREALGCFPYNVRLKLTYARYLTTLRLSSGDDPKESLNEIRTICTSVWEESDDYDDRMEAIRIMTEAVDDEDELYEWVNRSQFGESDFEVLMNRYERRGEWENYEKTKEQYLLWSIKDFCMNVRHRLYRDRNDGFPKSAAEGSVKANGIVINILDLVSDGGNKDAFLYEYAFYHTRLAAGYFGSGEKEEGYKTMEIAVDEILRWFDIPEGTEIPYECYCFRDLTYIKPKNTLFDFFTRAHGWEWLNSVREEPRYKELCEKVEEKNREILKNQQT